MKRLNVAFKMFWLGLTRTRLFYNVDMITALYDNIYKVAKQNTAMMFRVGIVIPDIEEKNSHVPIVSIWACPSISGDPTVRIQELNKEIYELKKHLQIKDHD